MVRPERRAPPHRLVGPSASIADSGRHSVTFTTPGSSRSRPSKKLATTSRVRPTWLPSARCSFIRLIISAIASGEMSLAAWEMVR